MSLDTQFNSISLDNDFTFTSQETEECFGQINEDSGISHDIDEETEETPIFDRSKENRPNRFLRQNLIPRNRIRRSQSLGESTPILTPVPCSWRRSSLQTPERINEISSFGNIDSEPFLMNKRRSGPPVTGIGSALFLRFLQEEINRSNLKIPGYFQRAFTEWSAQCETEDQDEFISLGTHLRHMADEFANSDNRQKVRDRAERVSLRRLDSESFIDLLVGLFQEGGVTWERVVVLFVFCADLALRALREHLLNCFNDVMNWSQVYIESWLTPWVQRHGGWAVILERSVHEAYRGIVLGVCMMGMLALWSYMRSSNH